MKINDFLARQLVYQNNGRFLFGLVQWPWMLAMSFKIFDFPGWVYWAFIPGSVFLTGLFGWLYQVLHVREAFDLEVSRYMRRAIVKSAKEE